MISIGVAIADEFTTNPEAACTNFPICTVTILERNRRVNLVLMPTSDSAVENSERWTASLVDGGSNYNFAAGNNNVAFDITDPPTIPGPMIPSLPVVGIATGDMPIEDGAGVTLTITSSEIVPATLTDGLSVTINIVGADATDFTNADCTNLVCIVTIPAGSNSVSLILSPLSDFSTEPGESWTATLEDGSNYDLAANDNAAFDIDDLIAAVGIATGDMPIEDGAGVTLTITSSETVPATLTGGLSVTINIVGADATDFTNADCTNLVCIVTILENERSVILTLSPLSDFSTEPGERWTATLVDGSNYDLAANDNAAFAITDLIAALGIATSNTEIIEGGAVTLTITSDLAVPAALTDGLSVTINIVGADNTDFTSAACTNTQCVITIPIGMTAATLTIMASTDSDAEGGSENWVATIAPDADIFTVDSNADIAVANMLPPVVDGTMLMALNGYATPTALAADAIRNFQSDAIDGVAITASLYADASNMPQIYVQMLEFAALGIWVNGNTPMPNVEFDHDYGYAFLGDNAVNPPATGDNRGTAIYNIEGDATYKGVNFFPQGSLTMHFDAGDFEGRIEGGGVVVSNPNFFGDANAMVPDVNDLDGDGDRTELRLIVDDDFLRINLGGTIDTDGFNSTPTIINAFGFFSDLASGAAGTMRGRFYDDPATYDPTMATPRELVGVMEIMDAQGNLNIGFLGRRP